VLKRTLDIAGAGVGLLALAPLFLLISAAVKLTSRGPVFFKHTRIGRYRLPVHVLKFRTMVRDGDAILERHLLLNPQLKMEWEEKRKLRGDPRVTRIGRTLRKFSLDELPQLWNVFIGDLSLVGPRPVTQDELSRFGPSTHALLAVRPGVTGLWQVNGRNDVTYEERAALELRYVREWSLLLDIRIILRTIPSVFRGAGAY
jgi:exopolysaccharide production protein ExoY